MSDFSIKLSLKEMVHLRIVLLVERANLRKFDIKSNPQAIPYININEELINKIDKYLEKASNLLKTDRNAYNKLQKELTKNL